MNIWSWSQVVFSISPLLVSIANYLASGGLSNAHIYGKKIFTAILHNILLHQYSFRMTSSRAAVCVMTKEKNFEDIAMRNILGVNLLNFVAKYSERVQHN